MKKLPDRQYGWFIGWIQKGEQVIVFTDHIADGMKQETYVSLHTKAAAKAKLLQIIKGKTLGHGWLLGV